VEWHLLCKSIGGKIGDSICEDDKQDLALEILRLAKEKEFHSFKMGWCGLNAFSNDAETKIVNGFYSDGWV
jgi:phosphoglycerate kinase